MSVRPETPEERAAWAADVNEREAALSDYELTCRYGLCPICDAPRLALASVDEDGGLRLAGTCRNGHADAFP